MLFRSGEEDAVRREVEILARGVDWLEVGKPAWVSVGSGSDQPAEESDSTDSDASSQGRVEADVCTWREGGEVDEDDALREVDRWFAGVVGRELGEPSGSARELVDETWNRKSSSHDSLATADEVARQVSADVRLRTSRSLQVGATRTTTTHLRAERPCPTSWLPRRHSRPRSR